MKTLTIFYIPVASQQEAANLAESLLQKKLIACANVVPIQSFYHWQNSINSDNEFLLLIKTLPEIEQEVAEYIESIHSYDVPCIACFKIKVNERYYNWAQREIK